MAYQREEYTAPVCDVHSFQIVEDVTLSGYSPAEADVGSDPSYYEDMGP